MIRRALISLIATLLTAIGILAVCGWVLMFAFHRFGYADVSWLDATALAWAVFIVGRLVAGVPPSRTHRG